MGKICNNTGTTAPEQDWVCTTSYGKPGTIIHFPTVHLSQVHKEIV